MHNDAKPYRPVPDIVRELKAFCAANKVTQSALSRACLINQSQVSRLLDGKSTRVSKSLKKLCIYASVPLHDADNYDPTKDVRLMGALRTVIANNATRARQIERLMYALVER
jgi:transcriptional regulator with XRE-family HTH domain